MKQIIIDIADDGEVKIETKGYTGKSCLEESDFLKAVLGNETHRSLTPAYYGKEECHRRKYLNLCG